MAGERFPARTASGPAKPTLSPRRAVAPSRSVLSRLSEADLFGLAPEAVRQSALDYAQLGNVEHPRRGGDDLAAEVVGQRDVYHARVSVRAGADGRPSLGASCSCPSHRMPCKHVLAVLYSWIREPGEFVVLDDLLGELSARSPEESVRALRDIALQDGGAAAALARVVVPRDWSAASPGEALAAWEVYRAWAEVAGRWPQAVLDLAARIEAAAPPLGARQLAWLLGLAASDLPEQALEGALARLVSHLGDLQSPDAALAAVDLALSLPPERAAEAEAVIRAVSEGCREIVEAALQEALWGARKTLLLAGGDTAQSLERAEALLTSLKAPKRSRMRKQP